LVFPVPLGPSRKKCCRGCWRNRVASSNSPTTIHPVLTPGAGVMIG
jgi:hypothetical protein